MWRLQIQIVLAAIALSHAAALPVNTRGDGTVISVPRAGGTLTHDDRALIHSERSLQDDYLAYIPDRRSVGDAAGLEEDGDGTVIAYERSDGGASGIARSVAESRRRDLGHSDRSLEEDGNGSVIGYAHRSASLRSLVHDDAKEISTSGGDEEDGDGTALGYAHRRALVHNDRALVHDDAAKVSNSGGDEVDGIGSVTGYSRAVDESDAVRRGDGTIIAYDRRASDRSPMHNDRALVHDDASEIPTSGGDEEDGNGTVLATERRSNLALGDGTVVASERGDEEDGNGTVIAVDRRSNLSRGDGTIIGVDRSVNLARGGGTVLGYSRENAPVSRRGDGTMIGYNH